MQDSRLTGQRLGKGLAALLNTNVTNIKGDYVEFLDTNLIEVNKDQPRKFFDDTKLEELALSIKQNGILQPIIVCKNLSKYKIIAGERRYKACTLAGITKIPAIIKQLSEKQILELALVENIQRENLNVIEESDSYQKLINEFGYTQETLATSLGKSRSYIANILRLRNLPNKIKNMVINGQIAYGHAKALIGGINIDQIADRIVDEGLSVRQTEEIIRQQKEAKKNSIKNDVILKSDNINAIDLEKENNDLSSLAESLKEKLNISVEIKRNSRGYEMRWIMNSLVDLDSVLSKIFDSV